MGGLRQSPPPKASFGGVLFGPADNPLEYFKEKCGADLMSLLTHGGEKKQVVGQAELLPSIAARVVWKEKFRGRKVLHFIDNEAARNTLKKGSSPNLDNAWSAGASGGGRRKPGRSRGEGAKPFQPCGWPVEGPPRPDLGLDLHAREVQLPADFESQLVK